MARGDDESTELSRALLAHRRATGLMQLDVAARARPKGKASKQARISQARLSRIEQGKSIPTEADIRALAALYGLDTTERERLLALTRDALAEVKDSRLIVQRGMPLALQRRWRRLEHESTLIRAYHPAIVHGALQTRAYTSAVMEGDEAAVNDRQVRHNALMTEHTPRHVLIQTEGALLFRVGSAELMREQLGVMERASRRPNVRLGVIPARRAVHVVPAGGFHIYDDHTVVVGLEVASATLTDAADVAEFEALFGQLAEVAVWGDEARAELARIAADTT